MPTPQLTGSTEETIRVLNSEAFNVEKAKQVMRWLMTVEPGASVFTTSESLGITTTLILKLFHISRDTTCPELWEAMVAGLPLRIVYAIHRVPVKSQAEILAIKDSGFQAVCDAVIVKLEEMKSKRKGNANR